MITLPEDFVDIGIKGYYWSTKDSWLYSIKSGALKYLNKASFNHYKFGMFDGWSVSDNGKRIYLELVYLMSFNEHIDQEMDVIRKPEVMPHAQRKKAWVEKEKTKQLGREEQRRKWREHRTT